jgi:hypothetical protein
MAILINSGVHFSKQDLARVLLEVSIKLDEDMSNINAFLEEALAEDSGDDDN